MPFSMKVKTSRTGALNLGKSYRWSLPFKSARKWIWNQLYHQDSIIWRIYQKPMTKNSVDTS